MRYIKHAEILPGPKLQTPPQLSLRRPFLPSRKSLSCHFFKPLLLKLRTRNSHPGSLPSLQARVSPQLPPFHEISPLFFLFFFFLTSPPSHLRTPVPSRRKKTCPPRPMAALFWLPPPAHSRVLKKRAKKTKQKKGE